MRFKTRGGLGNADRNVLGSAAQMLVLEKTDNLSPLSPEGFTKADDGLDRLYVNLSSAHLVNGEIVGSFYSTSAFIAVYEQDENRWSRLQGAEDYTGGNIEFGSRVILDRGYGGGALLPGYGQNLASAS